MEKEVSSAVSLAATLIAVSIVLTIVTYTVIIGNQLKETTYETAAQIETQLSSGQLKSMCNGNVKIMPKATIYFILSQEHNSINSLDYDNGKEEADGGLNVMLQPNSNGRWTDTGGELEAEYIFPEDIMSNELTGKVRVEVEENNYGTYDIKIEEFSIDEV